MTKPANKKGSSKAALTPAAREVLKALFCLSRDTQHISARTLADAVSLTATQAGEALVLLEQRGLVDATRARLTMLGLATAMQLGAAAGGGGVRTKPRFQPRVESFDAELPVAALPSQPPSRGYEHELPEDKVSDNGVRYEAVAQVALRLELY